MTNTNTMEDLRDAIAQRMKDAIHGREFDTVDGSMPKTPHMLGVIPTGAISTPEAEKGSILDPAHEFWSTYEKDIETRGGVKREVETAIQSLADDDVLEMTMPHGEDAGIYYVEVDYNQNERQSLDVACEECGSFAPVTERIKQNSGHYWFEFEVDCAECTFDTTVRTALRAL